MVAASTRQDYLRYPSGRRLAVHTPRLGRSCRCKGCQTRRWWTPERRAAMRRMMLRQYAEGRRDLSVVAAANRRHARCWTLEQDDALKVLAGRHDCRTIASMLGERFGVPRTESSVVHRLKKLGVSRMALRPYSAGEVGRLFGITRETVRKRFVETGLLACTVRRGGPHGMRMFTRAAVERLVAEHPEAYDREAIRDPGLRAIALGVARRRPLLTAREVQARTGATQRQLSAWCIAGLVPSARKVRAIVMGAGGGWLCTLDDLAVVTGLVADAEARRRARAEGCRRGHRWAEHGVVEPSSGQRRCRACRAARRPA